MIKVKFKGHEFNPDAVTPSEIFTLIENNRTRLRTLSGIVLTVCGLLLSATFGILFFILTDTKFGIPVIVPVILFITCVTLTIAILFSVFSAKPQTPSAVTTKLHMIDFLTSIHYREYRLTSLAVIFLIVSILLFITALATFGINLLPKDLSSGMNLILRAMNSTDITMYSSIFLA